MTGYNGLNSIKTNLEAAGICKHDGLRLSDPKCTHATPAQIARTKKMDADYDFMQTYKDQARLCNSVIQDIKPRIDFIFEVLDGVETDTINEHRLAISRLDNGVDAVDAQRWQDEQIEIAGRSDEAGCESVDVSQYFNGYKATATASWRERHLNES